LEFDLCGEPFFYLEHKHGKPGKFLPTMVKFLGKTLEVVEENTEDGVVFKHRVKTLGGPLMEFEFRTWMTSDIHVVPMM